MARPKTIASSYEKFPVRLPKELLRLLRARAMLKAVPVNTEIIQVLRRGLRIPVKPSPALEHSVKLLERQVANDVEA